MVKKLIVSLVFVVLIVATFTINAFAVAVTIPIDSNNVDPSSGFYVPEDSAFLSYVYVDNQYDISVSQRYVTTIPIVNPTPYLSQVPTYQYPCESKYTMGSFGAQTIIEFEYLSQRSRAEYVGSSNADNIIHADTTHQEYSVYTNIPTPLVTNYPVYGLTIPNVLVWDESYTSTYGVNYGNSIRVTIDNYVTWIDVVDYFDSGYCTISLYGGNHRVRCLIDPEAFYRYDDVNGHYYYDFNITWDMLNGSSHNYEQTIKVYDDEFTGSVIDYFTSYYEDTQITIDNTSIFQISDVEIYLTADNNSYDVIVDTCDRTDLTVKIVTVNPPQSNDPPVQRYTNFVINAVYGFFTLEILPGFTMGGIFLVMLAFSLVMWFLKVFAGG